MQPAALRGHKRSATDDDGEPAGDDVDRQEDGH